VLQDSVACIKQRYARAPSRWAYICNYVDDIRQVLAIARGIGQPVRAARLADLAVALMRSPSVRREVQACMVKRPKAPNPGLRKWTLKHRRERQRATAARRKARMDVTK
jgi:hypothetical protein